MSAGAHTSLMVWADCDDDFADGNTLRERFWQEAQQQEITKEQFERVVFIFAKDRLENWIQFLQTGQTNEAEEGPRLRYGKGAADAAKRLAEFCKSGRPVENMPPSLDWSCKNWRALVDRMRTS